MPEAVRKPFCGPSGRKIDSNGTPHTHQRFAEAAPSILLLRANNHFERFHTAWPLCRHSHRRLRSAESGAAETLAELESISFFGPPAARRDGLLGRAVPAIH